MKGLDTRDPRYAHRVLATFKCHRFKPWLGYNLILGSKVIFLCFFFQWCARMSRWLPGAVSLLSRRFLQTGKKHGHLGLLPLGYLAQPSKTLKPIGERQVDVFYAGSIGNFLPGSKKSRFDVKQLLRTEMTDALRVLQTQHSSIRSRIVTADSYIPHGLAWGFIDKASVFSLNEYSDLLGDSKIALVPRGTSPETFRFFEAAACGCILISDWVPDDWYFRGCPAFFIYKWAEIVKIIPKLIADPDEMLKRQQQTVEWWRQVCDEPVVAEYISSRINATGRQSQ